MYPMENLRNDIFQVNASVGKTFKFGKFSVSPNLSMEYDMPTDGEFVPKNMGFYAYPSISFTYQLANDWSISLANKFVVDAGGYGSHPAFSTRVTPSVSYQLTKKTSVFAGINMHEPIIQSKSDPRREQFVPKVGISYSF